MKRALRLSFPALWLCLLAGCSSLRSLTHKGEAERFGVLIVRLNTPPPKGKRVTYAMATVQNGRRSKNAAFQPVTKNGAASFVLPLNNLYDVRIFCDNNRNQLLDPGEPSALAQGLAPSPPMGPEVVPVTLAFGVVGPVKSASARSSAAVETPRNNLREVPPEAAPYLKYVPAWLQDKFFE